MFNNNIQCPRCGKKLSDSNQICPYCGYNLSYINQTGNSSSLKQELLKERNFIPAFKDFIVIVVLIAFISYVFNFLRITFEIHKTHDTIQNETTNNIDDYEETYEEKTEETPKENLLEKFTNETPVGYKLYIKNIGTQEIYGKSIKKDSIVDIYAKLNDEDGYLLLGRIVVNIKILAVLDINNQEISTDTFSNSTDKILFYVTENEYSLIEKTEKIGSIVLIPRNQNYIGTSTPDQEIIDYILKK